MNDWYTRGRGIEITGEQILDWIDDNMTDKDICELIEDLEGRDRYDLPDMIVEYFTHEDNGTTPEEDEQEKFLDMVEEAHKALKGIVDHPIRHRKRVK